MMSADESTNSTSVVGAAGDPEALRADIETTRANLGDTVSALASKTDVRRRLGDAATAGKARAVQAGAAVRRNPLPVAAGVVAGFGAVAAVFALRRRAAAKARARRRWVPGFLQR